MIPIYFFAEDAPNREIGRMMRHIRSELRFYEQVVRFGDLFKALDGVQFGVHATFALSQILKSTKGSEKPREGLYVLAGATVLRVQDLLLRSCEKLGRERFDYVSGYYQELLRQAKEEWGYE